jgi:hypothetical protein
MNGANSLLDSDLSLIDVSRGEIQARAWRGKLHPRRLPGNENAAVDLRWSFYDKNRQCGM